MGLAVLYGKMSVEDACTASRLEEESNVENWGLVEGGHDIDRANNRVMVRRLRCNLASNTCPFDASVRLRVRVVDVCSQLSSASLLASIIRQPTKSA